MQRSKARWTRGLHKVQLEVPRERLSSAGSGSLEQWLEEWGGAAVVPGGDAGEPLSITLPYTLWGEMGRPPGSEASAEELDLFQAQHAAISQLVELPRQRVRISSVGHIGAAELSFHFEVDGARIEDMGAPTPFVLDSEGVRHALMPCTFVAYQQICDGNARTGWGRAAQLAFLADLRAHLERSQAVLADSAAPFAYELDEHLDKFRARRVGAARLSWKAQKNPAIFDLQVEHAGDHGEPIALELNKLDAHSPVIELSSTEHMLLEPEVEQVARVASKQRNKLRKHVERFFSNPAALMPEGVALDHIDLSVYSPRVTGFAPIIKAERPFDVQSSGVAWYQSDGDGSAPFLRLLISQPGGGGIEAISLATLEDAERTVGQLEQALAEGSAEPIDIGGRRVEASRPLLTRLRDDLAAHRTRVAAAGAATRSPAEDSAGAPGPGGAAAGVAPPPPVRLAATIAEPVTPVVGASLGAPANPVPWEVVEALLAPSCRLKEHQRVAVEWMWNHYQRGESGVLLADDMGLGKTLQIAVFLALVHATRRPAAPRPSLIVCPVILLDNWRDELGKFFAPAVFARLVTLHGDELRRLRREGSVDLEALARFEYVLTNYETLQAHQQSLLLIDWEVAVLDEAHAIKNPDTYRARAARGLKRTFGVCSTGTPVENRLSDLWSLYDFLRPGNPFTTRQRFEADYEGDPATGVWDVRTALDYPSSSSSLLRRTKAEVLELPDKVVEVHHVEMTPHQVRLERHFTGGAATESPLKILQGLQKLYQHPRLLSADDGGGGPARPPLSALLEESPKLALCVELLRRIQAAGEKALVFTLWTGMQELLVEVLRHELGLARVRVLNGDPAHRRQAKAYIEELTATSGFGVLVLSPLAAGTGLTITAANHVIHYGRWWNPAKEDQATDRAYRIGQRRPVHVHYPLLHHPGDRERGFDVKLHQLVEQKRSVARDFLAPREEETVSAVELARLAAEPSAEKEVES